MSRELLTFKPRGFESVSWHGQLTPSSDQSRLVYFLQPHPTYLSAYLRRMRSELTQTCGAVLLL